MFIHLSIWFSFYLFFTYYLKKHTTSKLNVCFNSNTSQQAKSSCYCWSIVADKGCLRGENRYLELHYLFSFCIIILFCILIAIIIIIIIKVVLLFFCVVIVFTLYSLQLLVELKIIHNVVVSSDENTWGHFHIPSLTVETPSGNVVFRGN